MQHPFSISKMGKLTTKPEMFPIRFTVDKNAVFNFQQHYLLNPFAQCAIDLHALYPLSIGAKK